VGLSSLLSRLLGPLSSKLFPPILIYKLLKKLKLWYLFLFFVLVVPSLYGTYAYLVSQELNPVLALIATVGMQFGGQGIEVWNAAWTIIGGVSLLEGFVVVLGASTSILRLLWYYYVWNWIADNTEPTVSNATKFVVGSAFLLMATAFALLVDIWALPNAPHLSGYTYVLSNPEILTEPLSQLFGQAPAEPAAQEALNQTVNNSNVTG
jgi:hypothetical protein